MKVLYCTSQRQSRPPKESEVLLDTTDGMDWETFVDCSIVFTVPNDQLFGKRGHVSHARRNHIRDKIRDLFRLYSRD